MGSAAPSTSPSASNQALSGVRWTTMAMVFGQVMFLVRSVALARLLSREDFGLMGMSATVQAGFAMLSNFGLNQTIVSGQFDSESQLHAQLNTVFTADLIRRAIITALLIAVSYPTALFYNDMRLAPILSVACLTVLIQGLENEGLMLLQREMKWKINTFYQVMNTSLNSMIPIAIALWRRDVWALVWGQLLASLIGTALSYAFHPFRPRLQLDREALQKSVKFGRWFIVISAMAYITTTADNIFVGRLLGPAALGGYLIAYNVSSLPQNILTRVISGVMFPVVAALKRDDEARLAPAISRVLGVSTALLTLLLVPMAVLAPEIIGVFYGAKWAQSVAPLRVLLLPGLFRGLLHNVSPITMGLNRPDLEAKSHVVEAILFVGALSLLVPRYGAMGAAFASALAYFLAVVVRYHLASGLVPGAFSGLGSSLGTMALAASAGAAAGFAVLWPLEDAAPFVRLLAGIPVVLATTAAALMLLRPELRAELKRLSPRRA